MHVHDNHKNYVIVSLFVGVIIRLNAKFKFEISHDQYGIIFQE